MYRDFPDLLALRAIANRNPPNPPAGGDGGRILLGGQVVDFYFSLCHAVRWIK